jgi:hypothetical protein
VKQARLELARRSSDVPLTTTPSLISEALPGEPRAFERRQEWLPENRIAVIAQVRQTAGIAVAGLLPAPPAEVTLTPRSPRDGNNWFNLYLGKADLHGWLTTGYSELDTDSVLYFTFSTTPGRTYLLHLEVGQEYIGGPSSVAGSWRFEGAVVGNIWPNEDWDLLAAFTAASSWSTVRVNVERVVSSQPYVQWAEFYRCTLTTVD